MFLSRQSWMLFGFGAFGLVGCGGADWSEAAQEGDTADLGAEQSEALAATGTTTPKKVLALGDSIAFGFNPLLLPPYAAPPASPSAYVGYPEVLAAAPFKHKVTNASCPGETSTSFFNAAADDNGCRAFKAAFALHADYETTQAAFATAQIAAAKKAGKSFERITLNIGANDLFLVQAKCQTDTHYPNPLLCIQDKLPGALNDYRLNLERGNTEMRAAGYANKFVGISTYAINYTDALSVGALTQLNGVLKTFTESLKDNRENKMGTFVDVFALFQTESAAFGGDVCAAGLLIKKPDGTCDIHPSQLGREKIAKLVNPALK